ncbi:MAG: SDR family oxidoreductase [Phycisphaeraceae bacterium]
MELQGKTVLVTGATSGIGRATAIDLAAAGMNVVATGRRADELEKLAEEVGRDRVHVVPADMADELTPGRLIDAADAAFGRLDACISNAGVMHIGTVETADVEAMCNMVRVNYEAVVRLAYACLRKFKPQGHGHLIHVSSTVAIHARPGTAAYAGTKAAIETFTASLRREMAGTGVKVGWIAPGLTDTHLQDHFPQHPAETMGIEKMPDGHDLARGIRFMLEQPDHVHAAMLTIMPSEQAT